MFFNEDHLRITKVRTNDGINPAFDSNGNKQYKVVFAPLNKESKRSFEEQNGRLPNQLKMKIEIVKGYVPQPIENKEVSINTELQKENEILKAELEALKKKGQNGHVPVSGGEGLPESVDTSSPSDNSQLINKQQPVKNEKK